MIEIRPTSTMTMASEMAKIGRETKNFSIGLPFFETLARLLRSGGLFSPPRSRVFGDHLCAVVQFLLPGDHDPFAPVESLVDAPHRAVGVARGDAA